ncbi:hypothetical protein Lesp02_68920 [Lentzea sp. NBRC 105346]|nr:hypothetical protein Lesp02_68920 [Lentzea sp. NBRC 105346]
MPEYLESLSDAQRDEVSLVRDVLLARMPAGFEEGMQWGMITWSVPLSVSGKTYNGQPLGYVSLAAQKNYLSLYLMGVYGAREDAFRSAYAGSGKKLDMGKSCVRFRRASDLALDVIGDEVAGTSVEEFVERHRSARGSG